MGKNEQMITFVTIHTNERTISKCSPQCTTEIPAKLDSILLVFLVKWKTLSSCNLGPVYMEAGYPG